MVIDLIQHPNEYADEIVHRVPENGSGEFRLGSQVVVREGQKAVFVRDGKALDIFGLVATRSRRTTSPSLPD